LILHHKIVHPQPASESDVGCFHSLTSSPIASIDAVVDAPMLTTFPIAESNPFVQLVARDGTIV
jgi:hypothetical protein